MRLAARNIFLTGFMTSGKSTVGKRLAGELKWRFVDLDREVERAAGHRVSTIFRDQGEREFRKLESKCLRRVCRRNKQVIALGGGTLLEKGNIRLIRNRGVLIQLMVSPETVLRRLKNQRGKRPLLSGISDAKARRNILALLAARRVGYRSAKHRIRVDDRTPREIVLQVIGRIHNV